MINMVDVSFAYTPKCFAVKSASFTISTGEFVVIAGRNGSGKTTLTRLMMSLIKPHSGQILLQGLDTQKYTPADMARHLGYVFQNPDSQIFRDTVEQEVAYGPEQLGFSPAEIHSSVAAALEATGLQAVAACYPRLLSKGQKQRIAIASALAMKPQIMILDEPTSGQDAREKIALVHLLQQLHRQGMGIVLVTHDMEVLSQAADRVVVMSGGNKVFDGGVSTLFFDHDVRQWGLCEPVAVNISRQLTKYGVRTTNSINSLTENIIVAAGGRLNA